MAFTPISNAPLTDAQLDTLQEWLDHFSNDSSVQNVSELDGFLAAIVSGPQGLQFDDWHAALWGGTEHLPKWKSDRDFQRFFDLLLQHMNQLAKVLEEDVEEFAPIFNVLEEDGSVSVEDWCLGYERGVTVGGGWEGMPEDEMELLAIITLQGLGIDLREDDDDGLEDVIHMLQVAAIALHRYWQQQQQAREPVRSTTQVGRNDPCPCGSGKKFKQCCLH